MSGEHLPIDSFVSTTPCRRAPIVDATMTVADYLVASTPILFLLVVLASRGIPTLLAWLRERRYQAEWHRTFRADR